MTSVWVRFLGGSTSLSQEAVATALAEAGIEVRTPRGSQPGAGLLFFDAFSSELCSLLRDTSRAGLERVLAIASSSSLIDGATCWRLLDAGASDVFAWDHYDDPGMEIAARFRRWQAVDELARSPLVRDTLVGQSPLWLSFLRQIVEVARFTDASVLITGESGTGKELVAHLIHTLDPRPDKGELVILDCTTVVPTLSGSEFFGHEKGAFTGAIAPRDGAFAMADGGTLFLDEVGELPLSLQGELLRVIQEGMYKRIGSNTWRRTNFRLLCATNRDLIQEQSRERFRRDLYYRIAAWTFRLPSLRERPEDVPLLTRHFLAQLRAGGKGVELDEAVGDLLSRRAYPGNIRDLKQLVSRISSRHEGPGPITVGSVPPEERPPSDLRAVDWRDTTFERCIRLALAQGVRLREIGDAARETAVAMALREANGNVKRAARRLGVTDRALQMRRASRRVHVEENQSPRR